MLIDTETKLIESVTFRTNGCGFMISAADVLAEQYSGKYLMELHGLQTEPRSAIYSDLGVFPPERLHCGEAVVDALKQAFADFRRHRVEEFLGEKALICTCFGVSEEKIYELIEMQQAATVQQIGEISNAGTGCGSCQMMIQEMIDSAHINA